MIKIAIHDNWNYYRMNEEGNRIQITLPHDAMIHENRSHDSAGGFNNSWFETYDYVYEKELWIPKSYADKSVFLDFEGVYHHTEIYINDKKVYSHSYGYTGFHF